MRAPTQALVGAAVALTMLIGCGFRPRPEEDPLGKLPTGVTSAVPEWIPFRIRAGKSVERDPREIHLFNLRQLTDDGASGGAIWHPDGRSIVFERGECGQLHRMDLTTGKTDRVSPESGWASSPAFGKGELLFAYAQGATKCWRGPASWSLPKADIWSTRGAFIESPAFDGEVAASASSVAFTSTRDGAPELYVAGLDGSNVARITNDAGLDGGAAFSPDGSKLAWHAGEAPPEEGVPPSKPAALHMMIAGARGQHPRKLAYGNYNVSPAFLPDSQRVIFASDYDGDGATDFDLYVIDPDGPATADGRPAAKRITYAAGYDGDARFSPDGKWVTFTSSRATGRNVHVARWIAD